MKSLFGAVIVNLLVLQTNAQTFSALTMGYVSTPFDDQNPILTEDGQTLWFTIANHPQNIAGKKDPGDIWYSQWQNGAWSLPVHGGTQINDRGYNAVLGISSDGNTLFLANHYDKSGAAHTQGISVVSREGGTWSVPKPLSIPYFQNRSSWFSGQLTPDGSALVYAAESYDTKGAEDLYVTFRNAAGQFTEPKNLGPMINTQFQEVSPWLSSDKKYLYFSSNGRKGYGSFDVYVTERLDDTWRNWSVPQNMGSRVNTEGRDLFFHSFPSRHVGLYSSNSNSDIYGDIRFYVDTISALAPDTIVKITEIRHDSLPPGAERYSRVSGSVTNSKTGQPVTAELKFRSDSVYSAISGKDGKYSLNISSTDVYTIVVEAPGYVGVLEKLDIHTFELRVVELNFKLQPVEIGTTVNLKNVLFEVGKTTLLTESYDELNVVVDLLKANPRMEIELAGHTDNRGDEKKNQKLSQSRVDRVKSYIVSRGISAKRIRGKGYGGQRPIANSDSEESRRLNRRVEFTITKN